MKLTAFLLSCFALFACSAFAQGDIFSGTWAMEYKQNPEDSSFFVELQIAEPEQQLLYPAQLKIKYGAFDAIYHLLLVKQHNGQLAISRNKFAVKEEPFSIGTWTIVLNGTLSLSKESGKQVLTVQRIASKRYGIPLPTIINYEEANRTAVMRISDFLKQAPVQLQKIGEAPWRSADAGKLLHSYDSPAYLG
ncbi:MAG: hypothetical protein H7X88_00810, partial [Gloeobacteraceae cyanobacterium ES-bin-316]|nr:hypothetical protein [Ferruginibacter sp.]